MRILIATTDYESFLTSFYAAHSNLAMNSFAEQSEVRACAFFGVADAYAFNLNQLGHETFVVYSNNHFMQRAWAREHGIDFNDNLPRHPTRQAIRAALPRLVERTGSRILRRALRAIGNDRSRQTEGLRVLAAQVRNWKPDVVIDDSITASGSAFWTELRSHIGLLVGQHASELPVRTDISAYDLMISSLPNLVMHFREIGARAELHRLGFDSRVLNAIGSTHRDIPVSFVGNLHPVHVNRSRVLEGVCRTESVSVWGDGFDALPEASPLRRCWKGQAWGRQMFDVLGRSQITLNVHASIAGSHANNMRLYEATGMRSLLLTDERTDLDQIFEPGVEVATYSDAKDCADKVRLYIENPHKAAQIASAGQARTLREHTYRHRMQELAETIDLHLRSMTA